MADATQTTSVENVSSARFSKASSFMTGVACQGELRQVLMLLAAEEKGG